MQTFLPYPDYKKSASCLDRQRLCKQRVEGYQILNTLLGGSDGWKNHPAVIMWRGYEYSLANYVKAICEEWIQRGYKDTILDKIEIMRIKLIESGNCKIPLFISDDVFNASHRSNLLRKDPIWYGKFGWGESPDLPYFWPSKELSCE